jgi:MGT family glycosyltransferase
MKAAYIPVGSGGHILSSLPMITELVKKGVEVDYYAPESQRAQVEMTGARLCVFPEVQERYSGPYMGKEEFLAVIPLVFLGMAKEAIDAIMAGLEENRPDVIIADEMAVAGRLAAWKLGIPLIMMFTSYAPGKDFSIFRTWPEFPDSPARKAALEMAEEFQKEYGGPLLTPGEIFEATADFNISTLTREFQPGGESFGDRFFFAGAQIAPRAGDGSWQPPKNGKPLLYTSLGSLFNNWPEFYKMLFPVVKDLDINVLCSLGKSIKPEDLGEIPANVTTMAFTPQLEVLRHTSFFLTHAGVGSVMEALYNGVPMMCIPQMDEQIFTAHRMEELGITSGVLLKEQVTEESLRKVLTELIENPAYGEKARAMGEQMHREGGCDKAAQAVIDYVNKL